MSEDVNYDGLSSGTRETIGESTLDLYPGVDTISEVELEVLRKLFYCLLLLPFVRVLTWKHVQDEKKGREGLNLGLFSSRRSRNRLSSSSLNKIKSPPRSGQPVIVSSPASLDFTYFQTSKFKGSTFTIVINTLFLVMKNEGNIMKQTHFRNQRTCYHFPNCIFSFKDNKWSKRSELVKAFDLWKWELQ